MQETGRLDYSDIPYGTEVQSLIAEPLVPECAVLPDEPDGIREIAYRSVLRMILAERSKDRQAACGAADYNPREWGKSWNLSPEQHLGIKFQYADELSMLSTHVSMANGALEYQRQDLEQSDNQVRRKFQQAVRERLWRYVEFPGRNRSPIEDKALFSTIRGESLAVVAPPGAGKTRLQAEFLQAVGIGQPLHAESEERRRALVVLPSQFMVDQYMGTIGEGEFRTILGKEVGFGAIWEHSKATDADVTFVIASSVPHLLEKGYLNFDDYCTTIVDEGHFVLDGSLLEHLQGAGTKMLFFTATPAKDELRDLRRYFHYVEEGSLREFIEGGILNRSRLFSYFAHEGKEAHMAAELATQLVNMGRKVAVFCQRRAQGDEYAQTRHVIDHVNKYATHKDGRHIAKILGTEVGRPQNEATLRQYLAGSVRCIATVQMLGEGYNDPDLDAVILIGPFAEYEAIQKAGRCLRIGENESLIIEILNSPRSYSLWQAFGFDTIMHGAGIGYGENDPIQLQGAQFRPGVLDNLVPGNFQSKGSKALDEGYVGLNGHTQHGKQLLRTPRIKVKERSTAAYPLNTSPAGRTPNAPDPVLNKILAVSGEFGDAAGVEPVRTASFFQRERQAARTRFLGNAVAVGQLASQYQVPRFWLQSVLDAAEVPYEMSWQDTDNSYIRHYAARASEVIDANPVVQTPDTPLFTRKSVLNLYGLHPAYLEAVEADRTDLPADGRYTLDQLQILEQSFDGYPVATAEHISLRNVRREFRTTEKKEFFVSHYLEQHPEIPLVFMRSEDATGLSIPMPHISVAAADAIHDVYEDVEAATDDHISVTQIASLAGVSIATAVKYVDRHHIRDKQLLRSPSHRKRGTYLRLEHAHKAVEHMQAEKLPPTHLPLISVMTRLAVTKKLPATYARNSPERIRKINIGPPYNEVVCLEWSLVRELEERFALKPGVEPLDFPLLQSDTEAAKTYARQVQMQFVDPTKLEPADDNWIAIPTVLQELRVTSVALGVLLSIIERSPRDYIQRETNAMHIDLVQRARRHVTDPPPVGWYNHAMIVERLAAKGRGFPKGYTFDRTDRRLCRSQDTGVMDIYYSPQAYRGVVQYSRLRTSEDALSAESLRRP